MYYGFNVTSLFVAQVKREKGLEMRKNYNKTKSDEPEFLVCLPVKRKSIIAALRHFNLICCLLQSPVYLAAAFFLWENKECSPAQARRV
jgi:hypothetical protein